MTSYTNTHHYTTNEFTPYLHQEQEPRVKTLKDRLRYFYNNLGDPKSETKAARLFKRYENSEGQLRSELRQKYSGEDVTKFFLRHKPWKQLLIEQQKQDHSHESFEQQQTVNHSQPQLDAPQPVKITSKILAEQNFDQRKHEEELSAKQADLEYSQRLLVNKELEHKEQLSAKQTDIEYYQRLLGNKELEHKRLYNQLLQENEHLHSEHERLRRENAQDLAESKRKFQEEIEEVKRKSQQELRRTEQQYIKQLNDMGANNSKEIQAQQAEYEEQIRQLCTSNKKLQTDNETLSGKLARATKESSARTQQLHEEEEKSKQLLHQRDDHAQLLNELQQERHQVAARLKEAARRRSESKSKEHSEKIIYLKLSKRAQSNMDILHRITEKIPLKCVHVETPEDVPDDAELFLFVNFLNTCRMTDNVQEEFKTFAGCGKKQDMIFLVALPRPKVINNEQFHRTFPQQLTSASLLPQVCFSGGQLRTNPEATDAFQTLLDVVEHSFPGSIRRKIEGDTSKDDDVLMLLGDLGM